MFGSTNFESMMSGSHVNFKQREHPRLSEEEQRIMENNRYELRDGLTVLRQFRTLALEAQDVETRQRYLTEAHDFSRKMADEFWNKATEEKQTPLDPAFLEELKKKKEEYKEMEAGSAHPWTASYSIKNLFQATDDMIARIEEKASSFKDPDHPLSKDEMRYVIHEFLGGTNILTVNAMNIFFDKETRIGGILSGGTIYLDLVKKIVEKYGDSSLSVNAFAIAVDKEKKRAVYETGENDAEVKEVIITDDVIDQGGTMLTALWNAGEEFPNATIRTGLDTDHPGGFKKRNEEKYDDRLFFMFQDFADRTEEGKLDEARKLFSEAEAYAKEHGVELKQGWHIRKARFLD